MRQQITLEDLGKVRAHLAEADRLFREIQDTQKCIATLLKVPCNDLHHDYSQIVEAVHMSLDAYVLMKNLRIKISHTYRYAPRVGQGQKRKAVSA